MALKYAVLSLFLSALSIPAHAGEWSGAVGGEIRYFPHDPATDAQFRGADFSLAVEPEYAHTWDDGRQVFVFTPFFRIDQYDSKRTHGDIRELAWVKATEDWELRVGVRRVFWGVTEFLHLVDIINQTDAVEDIDDEQALGQPMVNFAWIGAWGTVDFFVLPGFRERTFPGRKGRPHGIAYVDTDHPEYASGAEVKHVDAAVRWSNTLGSWDIGVAHFYGTSRDPLLTPAVSDGGDPVLIPFYDIIHQTSLELQYTGEAWLWKLEALYRDGRNQDGYAAATGGFEYTFVGVFDSAADIGVIGEYVWDERGNDAPVVLENDFVIGTRLTLNDVQSTEFLAGVAFDLDSSARFYSVEASRRLGDSWKLSLEAWLNSNIPNDDPAFTIRNDDFLQLELVWFF
jgi:hypothetical protein